MSGCCSTDLDTERRPCPHCRETGPLIGHEPVRPHRPDASEGPWQHCATRDCPVVYHLGTDVVIAAELRTQVAQKGVEKPTPVCFCFSHTPDDAITTALPTATA
jgi:hypothetical protein